VDLVGLVAVTLLFGGGTLFLLAISPVGRALASRILGRQSAVIDEDELLKEVKELRQEVDSLKAGGDPAELDALRRSLDELAERVDFAERLLAQRRDAERLAPPRGAGA
jgi:hypothetical protein